ncbi:methyltransferase domain-containing protein [Streptomyces sp. MUM 203J]|uniref:methyltransferase domain-containing protein n=1 Tax=Streptomyces sp. MUM 203J TaxID=2791990 RepID=UPI001F033C1C|nr:methyltransferase domain-containing protein [Streptomyces sp. MUM 203J]MCH0541201.1 methyltransferase domain-containing protein [Streptomyces sp. MUM 203J]
MGAERQDPRDPQAEAAVAARSRMVAVLDAAGALPDPAWRAAFAQVPRHLCVPYYYVGALGGYERLWCEDPDPLRRETWLLGAYEDKPLGLRVRDGDMVSTASQPSLMAAMLHALEARDGDTALEIGAGSGYNAALLCHRLGDDRVTTVDLDPGITEAARAHLARCGHHPAVVTGDGARGCPGRAPFDLVIATCGLPSVPAAWIAQCRPGARIVAPLSTGVLRLRVRDAGYAEGRFLHTAAYFVPLRGAVPPAPEVRTAGLPRGALDSDLFRFLLVLTAGSLDPYEAYALWQREGRPERERYGVTVTGGAQWAWLDDPGGPYAWALGTTPTGA